MRLTRRLGLRTPWLLVFALLGWICVQATQAQPRSLAIPALPSINVTQGPEPLPLQRVLVSPERAVLELERARPGVLKQLPRAEFEALVREAAETEEALKKPPHLLEARYRARLAGDSLVGSGEWTLANPVSVAGIMPLPSLNLALGRCRWGEREAILGDLDGKSLGLLVDKPGRQSLSLEWSARGDPGPGGTRFELKVPACALTSFDLELPLDHGVSLARESCLLTGPFTATTEGYRSWRLDCSGWSQIDLIIRPAWPDQPKPLVLGQLHSRLDLKPDRALAEFVFNLEVLHGPVQELLWDVDPGFQPTAVSVRNSDVESWAYQPGDGASPSRLHIWLPEPLEGGSLPVRVRGAARMPWHEPWSSPAMHLVGAVVLSETLTLTIAPDLRLEDWQPGDFDLRRSSTDAAGNLILTLESGMGKAKDKPEAQIARQASNGQESPRRPRARVSLLKPNYRVGQFAWWRVGASGESLKTELTYEVVRGSLLRLPINVASGWTVDRLELSPAGLLSNWTPFPEPDGSSTLDVELGHALRSGAQAKLNLELRPSHSRTIPRPDLPVARVPFPQVTPREMSDLASVLAITVDPNYECSADSSLPEAVPPESLAVSTGPAADHLVPAPAWAPASPTYYYLAREQGITGSLHLRPRRLRIRARCESEVSFFPEQPFVRARVRIEPDTGNPDTIDLFVSTPVREPWKWSSQPARYQVREMRRLPTAEVARCLAALGTATDIRVVPMLLLAAQRGSWWRLSLNQPISEPLVLETQLGLEHGLVSRPAAPVDAVAKTWEVPLVSVLHADPMGGEVKVDPAEATVQVIGQGLTELTRNAGEIPAPPRRTFRYEGPAASMTVQGLQAARPAAPIPFADRARLTTFVDPAGRLLQHFDFRICQWDQRILPVRLPQGTRRLLAAQVDGLWVPHPAAVTDSDGSLLVEMPVAAGASHRFALVYEAPISPWTLWTRLDAGEPVLPLQAVPLQHVWCLPPGLVPVNEEKVLELPRPAGQAEKDMISAGIEWSRSLIPEQFFLGAENWKRGEMRLFAGADARLQNERAARKNWSLGEALRFLVLESLRGNLSPVLDAEAFRKAGLSAGSPLGESGAADHGDDETSGAILLRSLGPVELVIIPLPAAPLLTTLAEWEECRRAGGSDGWMSQTILKAVNEAVVHGQDESGRFRRAADWLEREYPFAPMQIGTKSQSPATSDQVHTSPLMHLDTQVWTEWEVVPGTPAASRLDVVQAGALTALSIALTVLVILAGWHARHYAGPRRFIALLAWWAIGGIAIIALPGSMARSLSWPLSTSVLVAAFWPLYSAFASPGAARANLRQVVATAGLVSWALVGLPGRAAAPGPYTVWLVPASDGRVESQTALISPELIDQLQALVHRGARGLHGPFLLGARYEGVVDETQAEFTGTFLVHSFSDEESTLSLPLSGVDLKEARLDGAAAYPVAQPIPQPGYSLTVKGRGPHNLQLRFGVRVLGEQGDQELRFGVPEIARSQLGMRVAGGARYLSGMSGRGAQEITTDSKGAYLRADLGRTPVVHAKWHRSEPGAAVLAQVRESYLWDLKGSSGRLLCVLQYTVRQGAPTVLSLGVPEILEVHHVETGAYPAGGAVPRIRRWWISGGGDERQLHLEFQMPVTGGAQVFLELVPRRPLARDSLLVVPAPMGCTSTEGLLAFRVGGRKVVPEEYLRIKGIEPEEFARRWRLAGTEDPGPPDGAFTFHRVPGAPPLLRLGFDPAKNLPHCLQDVSLKVGAQEVEVRATARIGSADDNLAFLEWRVPREIDVRDVRGPEIRDWSRSAEVVQVWLRRSVKETTLELYGKIARHTDGPRGSFQLPCLTVSETSIDATWLHVEMVGRLALRPTKTQNLLPMPDLRPSVQEANFISREAEYDGTFEVWPGTPDDEARILTTVEAQGGQLTFTTRIALQVRQGELHPLKVRLQNWEGQNVRLEAPRGTTNREQRPDRASRVWHLKPPPGIITSFELQLTGNLAIGRQQDILVPDVTVEGPVSSERWLAVVGQLTPSETPQGLVQQQVFSGISQFFSEEIARAERAKGSIWKVTTDNWRLRLHRRTPLELPEAVRLILNEQSAAVFDGRHWMHKANYRLYAQDDADLALRLPPGARVVRMTLDGSGVDPLVNSAGRFWLRLTGGEGLRQLCVYWQFEESFEDLTHPDLQQPQLQTGAFLDRGEVAAATWTVYVPPGHRATRLAGDVASDGYVGLELGRAAADMQLSGMLGESLAETNTDQLREQLQDAQARFYRTCRFADYLLALPGARSLPEHRMATRLEELRARNKQLAQLQHFEEVRLQAEGLAVSAREDPADHRDAELLVERGIPSYWRASSQAKTPRLEMSPRGVPRFHHLLGLSIIAAVWLLLAWLSSHFPAQAARLQALWPEQLIILGVVGWYLLEPNVLFAPLPILGFGARAFLLARHVPVIGRKATPAAP